VPDHFARHLRRNATDAEQKLWHELRMLKTKGRHFRRQVPIAGYVVDFACHKSKLIVELDGGQHNSAEGIVSDERRSRNLEVHGFHLLRFWNADVFQNLEGIVDRIRHEVGLPTTWSYKFEADKEPPPLTPPHKGEGHNK
jgi:very-short-patch-repair endonuclease